MPFEQVNTVAEQLQCTDCTPLSTVSSRYDINLPNPHENSYGAIAKPRNRTDGCSMFQHLLACLGLKTYSFNRVPTA